MKAKLRSLLGWPGSGASKDKRAPAPAQRKQARPDRYQAVSIACPSKCCAAVKSLAGQRFLARSAPALPLPACTMSDQCKCSFQKHADRRDSDRRLPGEMSKWYGGSEKRRSRGRRRAE